MGKRWRLLWILLGIGVYVSVRLRREKQAALKTLRNGSVLATIPEGTIEYAIQGQGDPVLIFHGGGGGYEQGLAVGEMLALNGKRVIAVSRPGHRRTCLSTGRTLTEQARAARSLLDHLEIDSATVIALSAGGLCALQFAIDHPEMCRRLILISAHGPVLIDRRPARYWLWLLDAIMASDLLSWLLLKVGLKVLIRLEGNTSQQGDFDRMLWGAFPASDWRAGTINDMEQLLSLPHMPLESIQTPTLVVHGTRDLNVPYAVGVDNAGRIPNARLVTIENGTHLMLASHQSEIIAEVREHLD